MFPFDLLHQGRTRPSLAILFGEAFFVTGVGVGMAWLVFPAAAGLITVFLISLGMQDSFATLLEVNRRDIWEKRVTPYSANAWLVGALVSVFLGCFLAFSFVAWSLSAASLRQVFASQFLLSPLQAVDLSRLAFGSVSGLLTRNVSVFLLCLLISAVYRTGGALLILAWNASVWALSFTFLSRSTIALGAASLPATVTAVVVGITPHLVLEAAAYVIAALVGIFVAKAVEKYSWRSPQFLRVVRACLLLVGVGMLLLSTGAVVESWWPTTWIQRFF